MDFQKRQIICYPLEGMTAIYTIRDGVMSFTCCLLYTSDAADEL